MVATLLAMSITANDASLFMAGIAAILAALAPVVIAFWNRLGHVNHAVNGVAPGEPTLRQVSVVTADIAVALAEKLGQLDSKVDAVVIETANHGTSLASHLEQDAVNFSALRKATEDVYASLMSASSKSDALSARMEEISAVAVDTAMRAAARLEQLSSR